MINAENLARLIINKLNSLTPPFNSGTPLLGGTLLVNAITEYVTGRITISGSYTGVIPPATPEVVPITTNPITGTLSPLATGTFESWVVSLESQIKTQFFIGAGNVLPIGVLPAFPAFVLNLTQQMLGDAYLSTVDDYGRVLEGKDPQLECMKLISSKIIEGLEIGKIPTFPSSLVGTGVTTVSNLIII